MAKKRNSPDRRKARTGLSFEKWQPRTLGKDELTPKRRLSSYDELHLPKWPKADKAKLIHTVKTMGKDFVPLSSVDELLDEINSVTLVVITLRHKQHRPPQSEIIESLKSIQTHAEALLAHFDIARPPAEIWQDPVVSVEINPTICRTLAAAARPDDPDEILIASLVSGIGAVAHVAASAVTQPASMPKRKLAEWHSVQIGRLFRVHFKHEPAKTNGGPWLTFLRWTRELAGFPALSDDRLRRLPI